MGMILIKLVAMLFPVVLAYTLKKIGFFGPTDYRILAKIAINITLPCTVVASFSTLELDLSLLGVTAFALAANVIQAFYAMIVSKNITDPKERCRDMFCIVGFNMGNFLIPFAQQFMGSTGVAVTALYDAGNSPMCTGGHYIFTTSVVSVDGKKTTFKDILRKLFSSPPLLVYIIMILFMVFNIHIPDGIAEVCRLTGNANAFVSMFMMGLMFEIKFESRYMKAAAGSLIKKYAFGVAVALIGFFLTPFPLLVRQVLVLIALAPVPSLASIFTENVEGDVGLASFTTSCSFLISSVLITCMVMLMNVA